MGRQPKIIKCLIFFSFFFLTKHSLGKSNCTIKSMPSILLTYVTCRQFRWNTPFFSGSTSNFLECPLVHTHTSCTKMHRFGPQPKRCISTGFMGQYDRSRRFGIYFKIPPPTRSVPHPTIVTALPHRRAEKPPTHRRSWKTPHPSAHQETTHPRTGASRKSTDPDSPAKHKRGESDGAPPIGAPRTNPPAVFVRFFGLTHRHR
jgi:hypothetical protein